MRAHVARNIIHKRIIKKRGGKKILQVWHFVWFFSLLIIFQSLWIKDRFEVLYQRSPEVLMAKAQRKQAEKLANISQPEIEEKLPVGGRLWFEQKTENDGTLKVEVWASADKPVVKVDIRLFYSPVDLEFLGDVEEEDGVGLLIFSQNFEESKEGRFLIKSLHFRPKTTGQTKLEFDFVKESLKDCNLINQSGEDILQEAVDLEISNF